MKKVKALYIDDKIYNEFRLHALKINSNVSKLIEEYMKNCIKNIKTKGA